MPRFTDPSRREFLTAGVAASLLPSAAAVPGDAAPNDPLLRIDYQKLVSRADLTYDKPVPRSEEGIPIGNAHAASIPDQPRGCVWQQLR